MCTGEDASPSTTCSPGQFWCDRRASWQSTWPKPAEKRHRSVAGLFSHKQPSRLWAASRKSNWSYLNNADHDDANPRGEKVFLKQILQCRQAALRREGRWGGATIREVSFTTAFTCCLCTGLEVLQASTRGTLSPQSVRFTTPQQSSWRTEKNQAASVPKFTGGQNGGPWATWTI